jgi:hypothetical protein
MWDDEEPKSTKVWVVKGGEGLSWRKSFREKSERTRDVLIRLEQAAKEYEQAAKELEQTKREPDQVYYAAIVEYAYKFSPHDIGAPEQVAKELEQTKRELEQAYIAMESAFKSISPHDTRVPASILREDVRERKELVTGEQASSLLSAWLRAEGYSQDQVKRLFDALTPRQREFLWKSIVRDLEMPDSRMHRSQQENKEDVSGQDIVIKDQAGNAHIIQVKRIGDAGKETPLSSSIREVAFVSYGKRLVTASDDTADLDEPYIDYADAYGRLEQKYAQLLDALTHTPSFPWGDGVVKEVSNFLPVVSEQPSVGANAVVRIEIDEDPLTIEQMGVLFSTLSSLATKYWLISQGRFADLIEFTKSHDERFVREAQAIITRISYNSPLNFDIKLSATDTAQAVTTTIDGIVQTGQRFRQMELATKTKEQEFQQAEQRFAEEIQRTQKQEAFEQEKRQLELARQQIELERLRLEVEQQRLGLLEARLDAQRKSLEHAFEIAHKVIGQLHPQADDATKRMLVQTYVGDILQLSGISFTSVTVVEVDQVSEEKEKKGE